MRETTLDDWLTDLIDDVSEWAGRDQDDLQSTTTLQDLYTEQHDRQALLEELEREYAVVLDYFFERPETTLRDLAEYLYNDCDPEDDV